jgi:serine/threonine-protein kinase
VRSDVYAFGATLYHLLTNEPPADARERFLHPERLIPPRQINPDISLRVERAILWAMGLHPDERPESIEILRQTLTGERITLPRLANRTGRWHFLTYPIERSLVYLTISLTVLSLLITLLR